MAAIPITLDGTLYDLYGRTTQRVIIFADASLTGVGVGGGPIVPPGQPQPPGIWPGPGPSHPIVLPGDPSWGPPPEKPPEPIQPPIDWHAVWAGADQGWIVIGVPNVPHPSPSAAAGTPKK